MEIKKLAGNNGNGKKNLKAVRVSFLTPKQMELPEVMARRKKMLIVLTALGVVLPFLAAGFLLFHTAVLKNSAQNVDQARQKLEVSLNQKSVELAEVKRVAQVTANLGSLLKERFFWSKFLDFLAANTVPEITYENLAADGKMINLSGVAKDYKTVARQLIAFKSSSLITDLKVSNLATKVSPRGEINGVTFNFSLVLDRRAL